MVTQIQAQTASLISSCENIERLAADLTQIILPLGIALSAEKDFDRLSERILREAKRICNADAGTLYLRTENNHLKFVLMSTDSLNLSLGGTMGEPICLPPMPLYDASGHPNHHNIAAHVALTGDLIHIPDIYQAEGFDFTGTRAYDEKNNYRSVSCLTVPLKNYDNVVIGVLQLLNAQDFTTGAIVPFSAYLLEIVRWLAGQAAAALNNQLLLQQQAQLLKGERDLQIGRAIQTDFLPETLPKLSGWEIAAHFDPAREVAGDFYDAFTMTHGRVGIVIADVCDKGVGAALFMSLFRSLIRVLARQNYALGLLDMLTDPTPKSGKTRQGRRTLPGIGTQALKNAIELTNNYISENHYRTSMFATLFFGVLDPATGAMHYINGGHEAPVICGPTGIKARLKPTGPAVGMMPGVDFRIAEAQLDPGDILFSYTDGVPEAHNPAGKLFSDERLLALIEPPAPSASALLKRVEAEVRSHIAEAPQFDDITMLAVRRNPCDEQATLNILD
jgi:sigma-B regulation protein RsbU (phosphoserine phosphatase)